MLAETRLIPIFRLAVSPAINKALTVVSYRVAVGIASFCIGGWQGLVMVIEQVSSYL